MKISDRHLRISDFSNSLGVVQHPQYAYVYILHYLSGSCRWTCGSL